MRVCRRGHISTGTARAVFCLSPLDLRCHSHGLGGSRSSTVLLTALRLGSEVRVPGLAGEGLLQGTASYWVLTCGGEGTGVSAAFCNRVLVPFTRVLLASPLKGSSS